MDSKTTHNSHIVNTVNSEERRLDTVKNCILEHCNGGGNNPSYRRRSVYFVFSYLFLILLSAPLLFSICGKDVYLQLVGENRSLAQAPDFRTVPLKDLPRQWDQYFKDRTPFRQVFMPGNQFVYEKVLRTFAGGFATGRGNELFVNFRNAPVFEAALGLFPYTLQAKENIRLTAAGKYAFFLSKGIPYYLFLVPDKSTLYPEFMPFYASWIPHRTWYQEQVETIEKAHIKFFPLNDFFRPLKDQGRLYDVVYDNGHWTGKALAYAYDHMAGILEKDNPMFSPVAYNEYYGIYEISMPFSVFGSEKTTFIQVKHPEKFTCSVLPPQYRTSNYNKICTNKNLDKGSLWVFSDSYLGATHGSGAISPFIHNVHTYIHRHYNMGKKPYTQLADETLMFSRPDAVIEEFVERMGGMQHSIFDPKLRILGDYWMRTGGILLDDSTDLSRYSLQNIGHSGSASDEFSFREGSRLTLKEPAAADDLGRVVVMGKISAPANASARIFYRDETGAEKTQDFRVAQGAQVFHETIHVKPFSRVNLSLQFLTPGTYRFEKIQEIDDLRKRM